MEKLTTLGIDLAKRIFVLHGVDGAGLVMPQRTVRQEQRMEVIAGLAPCLIGMEACTGVHAWALHLRSVGRVRSAVTRRMKTPSGAIRMRLLRHTRASLGFTSVQPNLCGLPNQS